MAGEVEAQHASEWYSSQLLGDAEQKASFATRLQVACPSSNDLCVREAG